MILEGAVRGGCGSGRSAPRPGLICVSSGSWSNARPVSESLFPAQCDVFLCSLRSPLGLIFRVTGAQCQVRLRILLQSSTLTTLLRILGGTDPLLHLGPRMVDPMVCMKGHI